MGDFPFSYRVIFLLSLMAIFASVDRYRHGQKATRFKEYGFILLTGMIGGVVGFLNDLVTASISPEYFTVGKGLEAGEGLRLAAGLLGLQTGFSAGIIGGAACLFACGKKFCFFPALRQLWKPMGAAILTGMVLPLIARQFDPFGLSEQLKELATPQQIGCFRLVWWIHAGLYLGLLGGLVWMVLGIRCRKAQQGEI